MVSKDAPEASSGSITGPWSSWNSGPSDYFNEHDVLGSASLIVRAQPFPGTCEGASYDFGASETSLSLQASGMSNGPVEDEPHYLNFADHTTPNPSTVTESLFPLNELALLEDYVNGGGGDPSMYEYGH